MFYLFMIFVDSMKQNYNFCLSKLLFTVMLSNLINNLDVYGGR